jgi:hypothetical protein
MKTLKTLGITLFLLTTIMVFNSCSKKEAVTPAVEELSILGKWQHLITKRTENGKVVFEYVGKPEDYIQITTNDIIFYVDGTREAYGYKVIEKNKKIVAIGAGGNGGDEVFEIRNLTKTTMTFYQESVVNKVTYINYIDFKK